ncbi:MAG TPA: sensor histidine kinase, partial [Myxococcales bacterium]|nr:sensor histidine kinase [Myxococcales bacterium]
PTEELPHSSARILVVDRGPGIAPEDVGRLFTPFFRATGGSGTGLGLVISREIVRQHGGDIQVSSRPGEGTTFAVLLPGAS